MNIMEKVRLRQSQLSPAQADHEPPRHRPEMLYIGCVDARLDPIADIGIEKGKALIYRNIAALVLKNEDDRARPDVPLDTAIPPHVSLGAVIEFFLRHLTTEPPTVKHIVVSGHTDCGGVKACRQGGVSDNDACLRFYLKSLEAVRARTLEKASAGGWDDARTLRSMEKESVRQSMANLLTYPAVREALEAKTLELHGWVIDTASQRISEMDPETLEFRPISSTLSI